MDHERVMQLPSEAFGRGLTRLTASRYAKHCLVFGFDCEYDSKTQDIVSYQLSDGVNSVLQEATECHTWDSLADWVRDLITNWGYKHRDYATIILTSYFSSAELSHIVDFWRDARVQRVSPGQIYNASYRVNKHQLLSVVDLYHFFNAPLWQVCKTFGEEKQVFDTTNVTRASLRDPVFREYAKWDAVVCARIFHKFRARIWDDHGIDIVKYPTPASVAMAIYRRHFLPYDFPAPITHVRRQAWHSLWGGRAEAYYQGDFYGDYTLRDVKALYPTSTLLLRDLPRPTDWVQRPWPESWKGLCRVRFEFPDDHRMPCLPIFYDGRLLFPLRGVSDCTLAEAKAAIDLGADLNFLTVWEYDEGDDSLYRYMQHFIQQKDKADLEDDQVGRWVAKLFMNSSIGKFSQHRGDADIEDLKAFSDLINVPLEAVLDPRFMHPDKPTDRPRIGGNIMPEWSALILGKARAIMAYHLADTDTYICSTDSLLIPANHNERVNELMSEHGVILTSKNENPDNQRCDKCPSEIPTGHIRVVRNRAYAAECPHGKLVFGATHAIHLPTRDGIAAAFLLSDEQQYNKRQMLGLKTAVREGKPFMGQSEVKMSFKRAWDNKRRIMPDGSSVPWRSLTQYRRVIDRRKP